MLFFVIDDSLPLWKHRNFDVIFKALVKVGHQTREGVLVSGNSVENRFKLELSAPVHGLIVSECYALEGLCKGWFEHFSEEGEHQEVVV